MRDEDWDDYTRIPCATCKAAVEVKCSNPISGHVRNSPCISRIIGTKAAS